MKLKITENTYEASNNYLTVTDDLRVSATSYDWWKYLTTDEVGNVIFNYSRYSQSTMAHQGKTRSVLRRLGIKVNLFLWETTEGLSDPEAAINSEIRCLETENKELMIKVTPKGTHKAKNSERLDMITENTDRIFELIRFRDHFLNKKRYHKNKFKAETSNHSVERDLWERGVNVSVKDKVEAYGKTPEIFKRWGIKCHKLDLVIYPHLLSVVGMLENLDPRDKRLRTKVRSLMASRNTLALDKLHAYLVNKANRKTNDPSKRHEKTYRINPVLETCKDVTPIVNRYQLRAEGKRQSHCIGSHGSYHDRIVSNGNQAFHCKGFTFYTTYGLRLIEAHGAHNQDVPASLIKQLSETIGLAT